MDGICSKNEKLKNAYNIFNSVSQEKGSLRRFRSTWEDNVNMSTGRDIIGYFLTVYLNSYGSGDWIRSGSGLL
jgi:hypothetical protein